MAFKKKEEKKKERKGFFAKKSSDKKDANLTSKKDSKPDIPKPDILDEETKKPETILLEETVGLPNETTEQEGGNITEKPLQFNAPIFSETDETDDEYDEEETVEELQGDSAEDCVKRGLEVAEEIPTKILYMTKPREPEK